MENSLTFLERISQVLIFCMALSLLFIWNNTLQNTISSLKRVVNTQEVLYEQPLEGVHEQDVTYKDIIGILMGEISSDTTINNIEIKMNNYNPQNFDFTRIPKVSYRKSYELDSEGNIVKIIFNQ